MTTNNSFNNMEESEKYMVDFYGKVLKGVENKVYTVEKNGSVLFYNQDGSTYVQQVTGRQPSKRRHMILHRCRPVSEVKDHNETRASADRDYRLYRFVFRRV